LILLTKELEVKILQMLTKQEINGRLEKIFCITYNYVGDIFRVAAERFRGKFDNYEPVILLVCRLIRWRTGAIVKF
jgi:hypothetical protein